MTISKYKSTKEKHPCTPLDRGENRQTSIFEYLKKLSEEIAAPSARNDRQSGSLDIDSELRAAVSEDIKYAKNSTGKELSRYEIASEMSELTGQDISKNMLDNWSAESHEKHRFPAQFLPAFVIATGGQRRVFEVISRRSGLFALPGPEALRAEIQRLEDEIKRKKAEKQKREIFLREMEK